MFKPSWVRGLTGVAVLGTLGMFALSASGNVPLGLARAAFVQPESKPAWVQRIALVDEALGRSDLSRATYEWREAYGAALRNGRADGLIAVGERAVRIAERASGSGAFRREASEIYVHAAFRARAERSRETILGIAQLFEALGEPEKAEQVRRIAASMS
jgi:hypothetical protein